MGLTGMHVRILGIAMFKEFKWAEKKTLNVKSRKHLLLLRRKEMEKEISGAMDVFQQQPGGEKPQPLG